MRSIPLSLKNKLRLYAQQATNPKINASLPKAEVRQNRNYTPWGQTLVWLMDFERALEKLSPMQRTVLLLHHGCGYSQGETAMIVGMCMRTMQRTVAQSEARLLDVLNDQEAGRHITRCRNRRVQ
ncbi:sigma factor-like helix-turn-helix DNA-binding protein [Silvibacterium acidisoli]|uniref:sigma factor-like helix-turn-helix DNA-binding protein n=1 Tax=Acidobacteriaceae bacterium ZG23-2 TaxID=2883246 RepID=UPI00406CA565